MRRDILRVCELQASMVGKRRGLRCTGRKRRAAQWESPKVDVGRGRTSLNGVVCSTV